MARPRGRDRAALVRSGRSGPLRRGLHNHARAHRQAEHPVHRLTRGRYPRPPLNFLLAASRVDRRSGQGARERFPWMPTGGVGDVVPGVRGAGWHAEPMDRIRVMRWVAEYERAWRGGDGYCKETLIT